MNIIGSAEKANLNGWELRANNGVLLLTQRNRWGKKPQALYNVINMPKCLAAGKDQIPYRDHSGQAQPSYEEQH